MKAQKGTRTKRKRSDDETTASVLIKCHYARLGLPKVWDKKRVERMCSFLRMTYAELGTLIGVNDLDLKINKTKPLPMSACILLSVIEGQFMKNWVPDPIKNIFDFTEK
jgi:hypothetical protein